MNWVIIGLIVLAFFVIGKFVHFHHAKNKFFAFLIILIIGIFILTFYNIAQQKSVDLKSPAGIFTGFKYYTLWLGQAMGNMRTITGNAARMDWSFNNTG
jgi:hypothetical protein